METKTRKVIFKIDMKILVTGGTGFIGRALISKLLERGNEVFVLAKHQPPVSFPGPIKFFIWDAVKEEPPLEAVNGVDAILHLVGENIFGFWTKNKKQRILESRELGTRHLVSAIKKTAKKPKVFISASAVGYYGNSGEGEVSEDGHAGNDFLATVCQVWEKEAKIAEEFGVRTVQIRTAPVLGEGGALSKMLPLFRLGLGVRFGSGNQWFSWVHLDDIVEAYIFAIENKTLSGAVNGCSPNPVRHREFVKTVAKSINRPSFLVAPSSLLRFFLGEMADTFLASQKVVPKKLLAAGFQFRFSALEQVFKNIENRAPEGGA